MNHLHVIDDALVRSGFGKVPRDRRRQFALDLALVVCRVRSAFLVDKVPPERTKLARFLVLLRQTEPEFCCIQHIHEPLTGQSFLVNRDTLAALLDSDAPPWTRFVDVQTLAVVPMPPIVASLIAQIAHSPADAVHLVLDLGAFLDAPEAALVPLAGALLEYPAAYVVPPGGGAYLAGTPLNVYECMLRPGEYSWLKFSCPAVLEEHDAHWRPSNIINAVHARFGARLAGGASTTCTHTTVTLERVAL